MSSKLNDTLLKHTNASGSLYSIPKDKINRLILNYFIQEGFEEAAQSFSKEAVIGRNEQTENGSIIGSSSFGSIKSSEDLHYAVKQFTTDKKTEKHISPENKALKGIRSIEKRKEIKYLILKGDITAAIDAICTNFPSVLDSNNLLYFKLLRLNLIEMIRDHKLSSRNASAENEKKFLDDVLSFVRENLVSRVMHSYELLKELEITMSLLCFNFDPQKPVNEMDNLPEELRKLFDLNLRSECYRAVNKAILDLEDLSPEPSHYRGVSFEGLSPEALSKLPAAEPLEENVDKGELMENCRTLFTQASKATHKDESSLSEEQQAASEALISQLERIAILWIATENKMMEKKLVKHKKYEGLMSDRTRL
ncbi:putative glucose-induced degradation protein [Clavispora lusitaniae]|uniref:Glucose-induced degradation protein n=1 Tax=Clavispora lusitaniae TaxID=36911 RepID=A0ACD0WPL2_CLALS|nr:putative glucose-induced degradation protein [Clavispora lusitaniae]QFZ34893.1 putative glucose-induced degradation protein [Clavispora lusitaniae]QFZ40578.1 putative glucose-induced degradation protein [Clavispora lusitaniae]QFZ46258.1 putative glucose-induced degradation protein [Clavispora lusitaniae]QFZ51920.1 putative glucose-induced degradation protein [Clavispora lusitaniae]